MTQTPKLPPFDYQPLHYVGPSAEEVLHLRRKFLNPGFPRISGARGHDGNCCQRPFKE
jgi:hypothetical protein